MRRRVSLVTFFSFASLLSCEMTSLKSKLVAESSVTKKIKTASITDCYNQCWDGTMDCCGIGFLLTEIHTKTQETIDCYFINCTIDDHVKMVPMEVIVSVLFLYFD